MGLINLEKGMSFIKSEYHPQRKETGHTESETPVRPTVTISRMTGTGGHAVAVRLSEFLEARCIGPCEWPVFDKDLVEKVVEDHKLRKQIADFMSEEHRSMVTDTIEELFGLHPSSWTLIHYTAETILRLAQVGNVIIVGRGGNAITAVIPTAFHVRLVGSLEKRIERVRQTEGLDRGAAEKYVKKQDKVRARYVKENFKADIDNPLMYHLIINTDVVPYDEAAHLIGNEVVERFHLHTEARAKTG